jgi:hypothetical protein
MISTPALANRLAAKHAEGSAKTARNSKLVDHSKTGQQKPFRENTRK